MISRLRTLTKLSAAYALVVFFAGCATVPESVEVSNIDEIAATVTAIDQGTRVVSLRGPQGNEVSFQAGPAVQNLAQVEVGDIVTLSYETTYIATRTNESEMSRQMPVNVVGGVAEAGQRPGAAIGAMATMTVRVESVSPDGTTATYTQPDGSLQAINIQSEEAQAFARSLRPGEIVRLTQAEALAIVVEELGD
ncbi:MAG: hypothetical protein ACR2QQ_05225 [Gammaproteobacteria bacterium]